MSVLAALRGALIVSVQVPRGSPHDDSGAIAAMSVAALEAGAAGLRIESVAHLKAVRARSAAPIIGIIKREYAGFAPYITPTLREVREVLSAGVEIVAFDATGRARPDGSTTRAFVEEIWRGSALAMADCALGEDGRIAREDGADILATTLCGYTQRTRGVALPSYQLVRELATFAAFTICEGGIATPEGGRAALAAGADAIVVGAAISGSLPERDPDRAVAERTRAFVEALGASGAGSASI